jgi:signal peptidase II
VSEKKKRLFLALIVIFIILFFDQFSKIWVKLHYCLGETKYVFGNWFQLHFVENEGMAFGMAFAGDTGKLLLTLFRLAASIGIGYYLYTLIKKQAGQPLIIIIALILAGALGNIVDSLFYGVVFSESTIFEPAVAFPAEGGYAPLMFGKVVDMFYFPLFGFHWPDWMPWIGGQKFIFFEPVFNLADAAITVGVLILLFFQKILFRHEKVSVEPGADQV